MQCTSRSIDKRSCGPIGIWRHQDKRLIVLLPSWGPNESGVAGNRCSSQKCGGEHGLLQPCAGSTVAHRLPCITFPGVLTAHKNVATPSEFTLNFSIHGSEQEQSISSALLSSCWPSLDLYGFQLELMLVSIITVEAAVAAVWYLLDCLYIPVHHPDEPPSLPLHNKHIGHILGLFRHGTGYYEATR